MEDRGYSLFKLQLLFPIPPMPGKSSKQLFKPWLLSISSFVCSHGTTWSALFSSFFCLNYQSFDNVLQLQRGYLFDHVSFLLIACDSVQISLSRKGKFIRLLGTPKDPGQKCSWVVHGEPRNQMQSGLSQALSGVPLLCICLTLFGFLHVSILCHGKRGCHHCP